MLQEIVFHHLSSPCRLVCQQGGGLLLLKGSQNRGESIDPTIVQLADSCMDHNGKLYIICRAQGSGWVLIVHQDNSWQKFPLLSASCGAPHLPFSHIPLMVWDAPEEDGRRIQARDLSLTDGPCYPLVHLPKDVPWCCAGEGTLLNICYTDAEDTLHSMWGDIRGLPRCRSRTLLQGKQCTSLSSLLAQEVLYTLIRRGNTDYLITCPLSGSPLRIYDLVGLQQPSLSLHNRRPTLCYQKDGQWLQRDLAPHMGTPWECPTPTPGIRDLT